jgi:hypothetical protein
MPSRARMTFLLDPWARLSGDIAHEPYEMRYNARWIRMALNLVGVGIKDCTKAADPLDCYSQSFVRYNLTHIGPAWVTDYSQLWRMLGVPLGRIEGAKALAAEQWLDPVSNSWGKPYVDAIARDELLDRPFGGSYELELESPAEVRLDHIDRMQVLTQAAYWVKQQ